jgi:hypothetical protein
MKQLLGVSDEELDARILKIAQAIKAAQPNATRLAALTFACPVRDTRKYYRVLASGVFECIIDARDAKDEAEAISRAINDTKASWYLVENWREGSSPGCLELPRVDSILDHNKFVDWLRR